MLRDRPSHEQQIHEQQASTLVMCFAAKLFCLCWMPPKHGCHYSILQPDTTPAQWVFQQRPSTNTRSIAGGMVDPLARSSRVGINGTLHRISTMRNSHGNVNGLTYRIGRHLPGIGNCVMYMCWDSRAYVDGLLAYSHQPLDNVNYYSCAVCLGKFGGDSASM